MKNAIRILAVVLLLVAVGAITWWAAGTSSPRPSPSAGESTVAKSIRNPQTPLPTLPGAATPRPAADSGAPPGPQTASAPQKGMDPEVFAERLHNILVNDAIEHDQAAIMLLDMLPACDVEQQTELSQHAANLLSDELFTGRIRNLLLDPNVHEDVKEVWYSDMLNRDPQINVPLLADVAKQKDNPFSQEAIDTLSIILNPDIAENLTILDAEVQRYLKELRDEEAGINPDVPPNQ